MKYFLHLLAIGFVGCSTQPDLPEVTYPQSPAIQGLATAVQLLPEGNTPLYMRDYMEVGRIDSILWPHGLEVFQAQDVAGVFTIRATDSLAMESTIRVYADAQPYDLVLHRSRRLPAEIRIPVDAYGEDVYIFGTFNAWNRTSHKMVREGDELVFKAMFEPGVIQYKFYANETEYTDENAERVSNGMGGYNSVLELTKEGTSKPLETTGEEPGSIVLEALPSDQDFFVLWENTRLPEEYIHRTAEKIVVSIPASAKSVERSTLRFFSSIDGDWSRELRVPLENGKPIHDASHVKRNDWHSARMYFMMVDRFANGDTANDWSINSPEVLPAADYKGGDIAGILQKLRDGYFDSLGVNTIWLSPISKQPRDAWGLWDKGGVRTKFTGYHGYWPISNTIIDNRFGDAEVVHTLLDEAHAKGYNVVIDYVANHVHQNHPVYRDHPDWATDLYLPDGTLNTERWDDHRLTTWFDNHLPTLDLRKKEVVDPMTDSAMIWVTDFDFDGFRHDATKHIDLLYWRTLTRKIKERVDRPIYQIGETYGSAELIASYLSTGMLNAQFDFNGYDAILNAIADPNLSYDQVVATMNGSWDWYGQHNTMGYISGNQDRSRFISIASGDVSLDEDQKLAGYTRNIGKPAATAYQQLLLLHVFNHSIPGIPVIYYGDEYGSPGANDPDNRRMMKFDGLDLDEKTLRSEVAELERVRASEMALLYGSASIEAIDENVLHITRRYLDTQVDVYINRSKESAVNIENQNEEILFGQLDNGTLAPLSAVILKKTL